MITLKHIIKQSTEGFYAEITIGRNDELSPMRVLYDKKTNCFTDKINTSFRKNILLVYHDINKIIDETKDYCKTTIELLKKINTEETIIVYIGEGKKNDHKI